MRHIIYGLCEPGTKFVRYVGATKYSVERRLKSHLRESSDNNTCHRHRWLRSLMRQGLRPATTVLEQVTLETWKERERYWIAKLKVSNRLVNNTAGGEGLIDPPLYIRRRISRKVSKLLLGNQYALGMKHTEESKAQISASLLSSKKHKRAVKARRGTKLTLAHRRKVSAALKGREFTAEHRARIGAKSKGNTHWLGKKHKRSTRAKMSAWQVGRVLPESTKQAIGKSRTGYVMPEAQKLKIAASMRRVRQENNWSTLPKGQPLQ